MGTKKYFSSLIAYGAKREDIARVSDDPFTKFNAAYKSVAEYREKILGLNFSQALEEANVNKKDIVNCEDYLKDIKVAWDMWQTVDANMTTGYTMVNYYSTGITDKLSMCIPILTRIIDGTATDIDKETLVATLCSIEIGASIATGSVKEAYNSVSKFSSSISNHNLLMAKINVIYTNAIDADTADVKKLNAKIDDINETIEKYNQAIVGITASAAAAPCVCGLVCFFFPIAAPFAVPITVGIDGACIAAITTLGINLTKKNKELSKEKLKLSGKEKELTTLKNAMTNVENSCKEAKGIISTYDGVDAPWAALSSDVSSIIADLKDASTRVDYPQLKGDIESALEVWSSVVVNMAKMSDLKPVTKVTVTLSDLATEESVKAIIAKLTA